GGPPRRAGRPHLERGAGPGRPGPADPQGARPTFPAPAEVPGAAPDVVVLARLSSAGGAGSGPGLGEERGDHESADRRPLAPCPHDDLVVLQVAEPPTRADRLERRVQLLADL